jgi:UDP-glucose 4-epimerase
MKQVAQLARATARPRRIAVTGGLGFVGGHMTRQLLAEGHDVLVFDIGTPGSGALPPGARFRQVDLRDPNAVTAMFGGLHTVYHIAGNSNGTRSVVDPLFDFQTNASATANVCQAAVAARVSRLVYLSSAMVYGRPTRVPITEDHPTTPFLPYGASKLSGEHMVRAFGETFGLPTVIGRAFVIYGPGEDPKIAGGEVSQYLRWHLNHRAVHATGLIDHKTRDFAHVTDVVRALRVLGDRGEPGGVYNIGTGAEYSLRQLVAVIAEATGRPVDLHVDDSITEDSYRHVPDISRLRRLGYRPGTTLPEGVRALAAVLGDAPEMPEVPTIFRPDQRPTTAMAS